MGCGLVLEREMNWSVVMFGVPESAPRTGGERYLLEVYRFLKRNGISVHNIGLANLPRWIKRCPLPIKLLLSNSWFLFRFRSLQLEETVVFFEDFHFHARLFLFNLLTRLLRKGKIVVLFQLSLYYHNTLRYRVTRWLDEGIIRLFFWQADRILTNSASGREAVLALGVPPTKVEVVYCGYEGLRPEGNQLPSGPTCRERSEILFVGRISPNKGLEYLLEAVALLGRNDVILNVVGDPAEDPGYCQHLLEIVSRRKLEQQVVFHGFVGDKTRLRAFYQTADVFVLPSITEGFGIVLLEAMSMGLPVVATNVEAIPELVKDGETGVLVPPRDASTLANALSLLLDSPSLRQKYRLNAQKYSQGARATYSWESVAKRIFTSLQRLAEATDD